MKSDLDITIGGYIPNSGAYDMFAEFKKFHKYINEMPDHIKAKLNITTDNYQEYFRYYLNSPNQTLFRKNESADQYLIDYWLAAISGHAKFLDGFLDKTYREIDKNFLTKFYNEHVHETNLDKIQTGLLNVGIYLIYEVGKAGTKVDGASLKVNKKPVIGLTLRLKQLDSFWFTLLHELSHIILHYEHLDTPITDFFCNEDQEEIKNDRNFDVIERQANRLAREIMIPNAYWRSLQSIRNISELNQYSEIYDIHPAIIAGRLAFEKNEWAKYAAVRSEYKINYVNI